LLYKQGGRIPNFRRAGSEKVSNLTRLSVISPQDPQQPRLRPPPAPHMTPVPYPYRDSPPSPPVEPTTRRVVPPPAPGLGARQARPTSATGLKGSGGGAATASTSSSSPSAASPTAAINKALRKRLFSGIAADGAQQRQAHTWQRPGPVLIAGTTAKGPVSTSTFSDAGGPEPCNGDCEGAAYLLVASTNVHREPWWASDGDPHDYWEARGCQSTRRGDGHAGRCQQRLGPCPLLDR
jgi:hypothetical protein